MMNRLTALMLLLTLTLSGCKTAEELLTGFPGAESNAPPVVVAPPPADPIPPGDTPPPPSPAEAVWRAKAEVVKLPAAMPSGKVLMDTRGMVHQREKNHGGMWEYMFLTLRGSGFDRVMLLQAGGGGRAIRGICEPPQAGHPAMQMEIAKDDLPGVHTWGIQWGGGELAFSLDGKRIGKAIPFSGSVNQIVAGGYDGSGKRDFRGEWSNLRVTP